MKSVKIGKAVSEKKTFKDYTNLYMYKAHRQVSEKKTFKDYTNLYMYKAQGKGQITPWDKSSIVTKTFNYFNNTL